MTEFNAMWAYGSHFRAESELLGNIYISYDSGIAVVALTTCQSSRADRRPVDAALKYVGVVRKIIRITYGTYQVNVMRCSWIKPNVVGNRTMRQDEHGFWLVKKDAFQPRSAEPYILPAHASQVCILVHYVR